MKLKAQMGMVMNLDKCIGCHTCSVTCKQVWTNRPGADHMWFNNVETKPGIGYPKLWEDQEKWRGGWTLDRKGNLKLKAGGQIWKLLNIFWNPNLPLVDDYHVPWSYDYQHLITAPLSEHDPVAVPHSELSGEKMHLQWGPNWEDDLAGAPARAVQDPDFRSLEGRIALEYEQVFMFYLPRICEHCMNPSCVASCPSGAMYKREEDGIVLVDQDKCRGWRFCVSGCPYKKVYFNERTGKAEKCTFCYPRVEDGQPTICSETCVGRLRYLGIVLYDADQVEAAASTPNEQDLRAAHLGIIQNPNDPEVQAQARRDGIPDDWIDAARRSPIYSLAAQYQVALPLHPEFRTLPMVWYVPPLSPVLNALEKVDDDADPDDVFPAIDSLRIPVEYIANMLTAGDQDAVRTVLKRLAAMRWHMRLRQIGRETNGEEESVGMTGNELEDMYRLLAIAKYEDRYVIPKAHTEVAGRLEVQRGSCGYDFESRPRVGDSVPAPKLDGTHFMLTQTDKRSSQPNSNQQSTRHGTIPLRQV